MTRDIFRLQAEAELSLNNPTLIMLDRRADASWFIAIVRGAFESQSEVVSKHEFMDRLDNMAGEMLERDSLPKKFRNRADLADSRRLANEIFDSLIRPSDARSGYGWIRVDVDVKTRESMVTMSTDAIEALEVLRRINDESNGFTATRAADVNSQVTSLKLEISQDRREHIRRLERFVAPYNEELSRLKAGGELERVSQSEVEERLQHIIDLLLPMPAAIRRVAESERDSVAHVEEELLSQIGSGRMDLIMNDYVEDFIRRFERTEDGQSFRRAEKLVVRSYLGSGIEEAIEELQRSTYYSGKVPKLLENLSSLTLTLQDELSGVAAANAASMGVVEGLTRRISRGRYLQHQEDLAQLRRIFSFWSSQNGRANLVTDVYLPYGGVRRRRFVYDLGSTLRSARPRALSTPENVSSSEAILRALRSGAPRVARMARLILENPVYKGELIDVIASFNQLPEKERLIQEAGGLLSALGTGSNDLTELWLTFDVDRLPHARRSARLCVQEERLRRLIRLYGGGNGRVS